MQAAVGDRLHVHGNIVGQADRVGEIVEVHGAEGGPPYLVRFEDGHTSLCFPGPDAVVERAGAAGGGAAAGRGTGKGRRPSAVQAAGIRPAEPAVEPGPLS